MKERFRTWRSSVRLRLTLWNVLILALSLMVSGVLLQRGMHNSLMQAVDDDLTMRSRGFGDQWPWPQERQRHWIERQQHAPPNVDKRESLTRPHIVDSGNRDYFSRLPEPLLDPSVVRQCFRTGEVIYSTVDLEGPGTSIEHFRVISVPLHGRNGPTQAILQSAASLSSAEHELNRLNRRLLALVPLALLIAGLGAAFLTDRALRPVRAVTRAAAGIGAAEDLSERLSVPGNDEFSHLAETFNGMIARLDTTFRDLERAYEQQRQFVADASHELRTPLTIIKANTSLALSESDLAPDMRETLTEIDRGVDRTNRIVQDLFLLARSDGGQLPMEWAPIDMALLVRDVADHAHFLRRKEGEISGPVIHLQLPLEKDSGSERLIVCGDASYLERIIGNILENALRHTPSTGTITLTVAPGDINQNQVVITVADTGEGIAPEHLPRVRERFYRVDSGRARSDGGTGLGLAISEAMVQAHGGSLRLESTLGKGTTVIITLPRSEDVIGEA